MDPPELETTEVDPQRDPSGSLGPTLRPNFSVVGRGYEEEYSPWVGIKIAVALAAMFVLCAIYTTIKNTLKCPKKYSKRDDFGDDDDDDDDGNDDDDDDVFEKEQLEPSSGKEAVAIEVGDNRRGAVNK